MKRRIGKFATVPAMVAAVSLAVPAGAAPLRIDTARTAQEVDTSWHDDAQTAERHRRNRGYRDRGTSVGDVLTGVLIIGGIAAIANAATKNRDRDYRYPERDERYRDYPRTRDSGLDNAAELCLAEIERDQRVENVDSVERTAEGWFVRGRLYDGAPFTCVIGPDGRIDDIDYGASASRDDDEGDYEDRDDREYGLDDGYAAAPAPGQWDDARYEAARRDALVGGPDAPARAEPRDVPTLDGPQPAYPGGPLPGEKGYEEPDTGSIAFAP
ncbi:hypothetical protein [Qipengyuania atrilutea]|uniref:PepSY domain-containing protein n=1 Tax=Qipengyuania atrilutea TaxID=2744473 RepID=A0A850H2E3_9SPHN|nr:hypothetical protein [Actirhodobacter atriluteus]NVD44083.1 hypothetical protein [Actirhodobacter atriluteus]